MQRSSSLGLVTRQQMLWPMRTVLHSYSITRKPTFVVHAAKGFGNTKKSTRVTILSSSHSTRDSNVIACSDSFEAHMNCRKM